MLPGGLTAIFFDAVGTLLEPEPPAAAVYARVGRRFGSRLDPATIADRFARAYARQEALDRAQGLATSERREKDRWREIVAEVLDDVREPAACFRELFDHFAQPEAWRCPAEAAPVLAELAGRGLALGLASNYDQRLRSVAAGLPELAPLRHLAISSEIGWRKPAAQFFQAACRLVGRRPDQVLFVGDDPVNDFDGALAAGLHACLFDPKGRAARPVRIGRLAELL